MASGLPIRRIDLDIIFHPMVRAIVRASRSVVIRPLAPPVVDFKFPNPAEPVPKRGLDWGEWGR